MTRPTHVGLLSFTMMTLGSILIATLAGCASETAPATPTAPAVLAGTPEPSAGASPSTDSTPQPTPSPVPTATSSPVPKPITFARITRGAFLKVVVDPERYAGRGYVVWACITQFDATTGTERFRADSSNRRERDWGGNGENSFFAGTASRLADYVAGDVVSMHVAPIGTVADHAPQGVSVLRLPLFEVETIKRQGSC